MSEQHTPEPWHTSEQFPNLVSPAEGNDGLPICATRGPDYAANSTRIVACVNFCAGVPASTLAHTSLADTLVALNAADDLRRQRDDLASVLRAALPASLPATDFATDLETVAGILGGAGADFWAGKLLQRATAIRAALARVPK